MEEIKSKLQTGVHAFSYVTASGSVKRTFGTLDQKIIRPLVEYQKLVDAADKLAAYCGRDVAQGIFSDDLKEALGEYDNVRKPYQSKQSDKITYYDLQAGGFRVFDPNLFQAFLD